MNIMLNLIAVAASVLGSSMAFPQARRLVLTRNVDGISSVWVGVSMAINLWWTAYALASSIWALLPVSVASFLLYAAIAVVYLRSVGRRGIGGVLLGAFGLGMAPLPFLVFGGWAVAGPAVGLCYGIQLAPAVVAAHRSRRLDGIAPGTWILSFVEGVLWLIYGAVIADAALVAGGVVGVVLAGAILLRLAVTGHRPLALRLA
jgi:uncharacterized protein with PQ loop repeat